MTYSSLDDAFSAIGITDVTVRQKAADVVRDFLEQRRQHFTETANMQTSRNLRELNLLRADGFTVTIDGLDKEHQ